MEEYGWRSAQQRGVGRGRGEQSLAALAHRQQTLAVCTGCGALLPWMQVCRTAKAAGRVCIARGDGCCSPSCAEAGGRRVKRLPFVRAQLERLHGLLEGTKHVISMPRSRADATRVELGLSDTRRAMIEALAVIARVS